MIDIPHHITFNVDWKFLLGAWISLHSLYFLVTHYHSLTQVKKYIKKENAELNEIYGKAQKAQKAQKAMPRLQLVQMDPIEIFLRTAFRSLVGFEWLIGQIVARTFLKIVLTVFNAVALLEIRVPKLWDITWHGKPQMMTERYEVL